MTRFIYYAVWTVVIGFVLYQGSEYQSYLAKQAETTYEIMPRAIFTTIFPILVGMLLKLPDLWIQRLSTKWGVDWPKLIVVGIPSLYISSELLLSFTPLAPYLPFLFYISTTGYPTLTMVSGIVFGYVVLDSIRVPNDRT
ncbi:hypothetical protein [Pontibacillus marinus]|uniref:Uncharacterized protein n=1 Tax=Pontibacillus marinus BH030004 = DSM 16465 TaxID=1385511 RepID=A0A0A5G465_9BACI|nr:hypothetical protein [Pontibacillus marinus]KGX85923.1 hypothetical protein N783_13100 [Pontibacillus marinus BH030004 = DSM 16465]